MDIVDTSDARPRGLLVFRPVDILLHRQYKWQKQKIAIIGQYVNGRNTIYNIRRRGAVLLPSAGASLESYAPAIGLSGRLPWDRDLCCSSIFYLIIAYLWY